jgi:hypothetical protein
MSTSIGVLTQPGQQTHALNIVRTWDPYVANIMVLLPVALSLSVSVVWSVVASVIFKADVQACTQTGFTIGGYVVTADTWHSCSCCDGAYSQGQSYVADDESGSLPIALVAFLDTKVNAGE